MTRIAIPPDLPWFDGHFPGRPVLPGVAQLAFLDELLRGSGRALAGFERLRFRREVVPGQEIEIEIREDMRFAVRRAGEIVCDGIARVREAGTGVPVSADAAEAPAPDPALPPAHLLLPHGGVMRFVEALVASGSGATTALARVGAASPLVRDGSAPIVLALEMAAQAAACAEALKRSRDAGVAAPREGRLVGASAFALVAEAIPAGRVLTVSIALARDLAPMAVYDATVAEGGRVLATGNVSTYLV